MCTMCALYTITNWEVQNPERSFCTTMSDKLFSAVTYIWSWDLIGISFYKEGESGKYVGCIPVRQVKRT